MKIDKDYKFPVSLSKEAFVDKVIAGAMIGSNTEENKKIRKRYGYRKNATIHYERLEITSEDLLFSLSEGHVVCQLFKDGKTNVPFKVFTKSQKKNDNFEAAYVVFVDIDKTDKESVKQFVSMLSLQPTFYYTTYSNLQGNKGLRFRLVYVFDGIIATNPYTYKYITHYINDIIEQDTFEDVDDKCNERCSQYFNGTNKNCNGVKFESGITNIIYSLSDIYGNDKEGFINGLRDFLIAYCEYSSYNIDHIDHIKKLLKLYTKQDYIFNSKEKMFVLPSDALLDNQMYNYSTIQYKCTTSLKYAIRDVGFKGHDTFMKYNRHKYNYIYRKEKDEWIDDEYQITGDDYFSLFYYTSKVKDHEHRRINLYERACLRRVLCPTVDADTLLFCMYEDIYRFFDYYSDSVLNLTCMVYNVENAMNQPIEAIKEKYKGTIEELKKRKPEIILKKGVAHGSPEHKRKVRLIKLRIVKELYDVTKTKKENRIIIKEKTGLDLSEKTLQRYTKEIDWTNTKENVKNEGWTNTKEKCYSVETQEVTEGWTNTKENVKNERVDKLHSIVYLDVCDVDEEEKEIKKEKLIEDSSVYIEVESKIGQKDSMNFANERSSIPEEYIKEIKGKYKKECFEDKIDPLDEIISWTNTRMKVKNECKSEVIRDDWYNSLNNMFMM